MDRIVYETDGSLEIFRSGVVRHNFARHHREINTVADFKATLRAGASTSVGDRPLRFICDDGESLCFDCARKEARLIMRSISDGDKDGWRVIGAEVHWEGPPDLCAHCGEPIESAHGDPEAVAINTSVSSSRP